MRNSRSENKNSSKKRDALIIHWIGFWLLIEYEFDSEILDEELIGYIPIGLALVGDAF